MPRFCPTPRRLLALFGVGKGSASDVVEPDATDLLSASQVGRPQHDPALRTSISARMISRDKAHVLQHRKVTPHHARVGGDHLGQLRCAHRPEGEVPQDLGARTVANRVDDRQHPLGHPGRLRQTWHALHCAGPETRRTLLAMTDIYSPSCVMLRVVQNMARRWEPTDQHPHEGLGSKQTRAGSSNACRRFTTKARPPCWAGVSEGHSVETSQRRTHRGAVRLLESDVVGITTKMAANLRGCSKAVTPLRQWPRCRLHVAPVPFPPDVFPTALNAGLARLVPVSLPPARCAAGATQERNLKEVPDRMSDPSRRWLPSRLRGHVGQRRGLTLDRTLDGATIMNQLRGRLVVETAYPRTWYQSHTREVWC